MSRERMISRSFFSSEQVSRLSIQARLTFVGIIVTSDDHGRRTAGAHALRADIFPCDPDVTNDQVKAWRQELADAGLIRLYTDAGREVLDIPTFHRWQKLRYHSRSKFAEFPGGEENLSGLTEPCPDQSDFAEKRREEKRRTTTPTSTPKSPAKRAPRPKAASNTTDRTFAKDFLQFYIDEIAAKTGLPKPTGLTDARKQHLKARLADGTLSREKWPTIAEKIVASAFLRGEGGRESWKGATFDWVIKSASNPVKVLEGNYDGRQKDTPKGERFSEIER